MMNKAEIVEAISEDKTMPFIQPEQLSEIMDFVINNYKPSLPSNLDEAANDYCSAYYDWDDEGERKEVVRTFKAGAAWMAGQGATMEITDDTEWADLDSFVHKNVTGRSIIQIRKK